MAEETSTPASPAIEVPTLFGKPVSPGGVGASSIFAPATFGAAAPIAPAAGGEAGDEDAGADERHGADFKPLVQLAKVDIESGEDEEEVIFKRRCKVYLFIKEDIYGGEKRTNYWKERGTGDVKLLKHKTFGKIRLLMRQETTFKVCANHLVSPSVELEPNVGSEKSWVFSANDFAEGTVEEKLFAVKFGSVENAQDFKKAVDAAKEVNKTLMADEEATESSDEEEEEEETAEVAEEAAAAPSEQEKEAGEALASEVEKLDVKAEDATAAATAE